MQYLKTNSGQFVRADSIDYFRVDANALRISVYVGYTLVAASGQYPSQTAADDALAALIDNILSGDELVEFPPVS